MVWPLQFEFDPNRTLDPLLRATNESPKQYGSS